MIPDRFSMNLTTSTESYRMSKSYKGDDNENVFSGISKSRGCEVM